MPDENKFEKLRSIGYRIPITCGLCIHGPWPAEVWGTCDLHKYQHLRQDNPNEGRGISVHVSGTCSSAAPDPNMFKSLGAHIEFLEPQGPC